MTSGWAIATECSECGEERLVYIAEEYGYNPGTDGHFLRSEESAREWAAEMNEFQPVAKRLNHPESRYKYFPVYILIERV